MKASLILSFFLAATVFGDKTFSLLKSLKSKTPKYSCEGQTISSVLDTDLYKLTMQSAVHKHFGANSPVVEYKFIDRRNVKFNKAAFDAIKQDIYCYSKLRLTEEEVDYLHELSATKPLTEDYVTYLRGSGVQPVDLRMTLKKGGELELTLKGPWLTTILYEVPVMAIISENYFRHVDKEWTMDDQKQKAHTKFALAAEKGIVIAEFGTRRRRSFATQEIVMNALAESALKVKLTSNVHFAMKYREKGVQPTGTIAHEWTMAWSVLKYDEKTGKTIILDEVDVAEANDRATKMLFDVVGAEGMKQFYLLPDALKTPVFLTNFTMDIASGVKGLRQDSGDAKTFIQMVKAHFVASGGQELMKKFQILFSDSLQVSDCLDLQKATVEAGFAGAAFGVGTSLTNNFGNSKPLNMVIKLNAVFKSNGKRVPLVKLGDRKPRQTSEKSGGFDKEATATVKARALELTDDYYMMLASGKLAATKTQ